MQRLGKSESSVKLHFVHILLYQGMFTFNDIIMMKIV